MKARLFPYSNHKTECKAVQILTFAPDVNLTNAVTQPPRDDFKFVTLVGIQPENLSTFLDEFAFWFKRRHSHAPGMIFYRLLQAMVQEPSGRAQRSCHRTFPNTLPTIVGGHEKLPNGGHETGHSYFLASPCS